MTRIDKARARFTIGQTINSKSRAIEGKTHRIAITIGLRENPQ